MDKALSRLLVEWEIDNESQKVTARVADIVDLYQKHKQEQARKRASTGKIGRPRGHKIQLPSIEELRKMLMRSNLKRVAKELGVNRQTVRNRLKESE